MIESRTISIDVYRSPDGKPTCCLDFTNGYICKFLRTTLFGTRDVCLITGIAPMRDAGGVGWTRPVFGCVFWDNKEQS